MTNYTAILMVVLLMLHANVYSQVVNQEALDRSVRNFLDQNRSEWRDLNIPYEDGQVLFDIIVENGYQSALEIGTSTGHSTIWIAWALSKTGGKLITIELNEQRLEVAKENLNKSGLIQFVDMRLADAHELVKELPGPFDFVFSDADKDWYTQYFIDMDPKLKQGGCFTAHNVRNNMSGIDEFMDYLKAQDNYKTTVDKTSRSGLSISYKMR